MSSHPNAQPRAHSNVGFNGQLHEAGSSWQLLGNGYRAYNPVLMHFQSPDSLSPFDEGGFNSYAYCEGDPRNRVDPSGHSPLLVMISGLVVGAAGIAVATKTSGKEQAAAIGLAVLGFAGASAGLAWGINQVATQSRVPQLWREIRTRWKNRAAAPSGAIAGIQRPPAGTPPQSRPSSVTSTRSSRSSSASSGSGQASASQSEALEQVSVDRTNGLVPEEGGLANLKHGMTARELGLVSYKARMQYVPHAPSFALTGRSRTTKTSIFTQHHIRQGGTGQ